MTVEHADHQRADAERIAGADQLLVGQRHERVGAFERAQPVDEAVDEPVALGTGDQMQDDLGVGGRLHQRAVAHELAAQRQAVGQVAVMADCEAAAVELGEQRLHVAQDGLAGGRIAHVADRRRAGQPVDHLAAGEIVADQPHAPLGMKPGAVERDDAGGFLAAVLERVQTERRDGGGVRVVDDAEHAALFAQAIVVTIEFKEAVAVGELGQAAHRGVVPPTGALTRSPARRDHRRQAAPGGDIEP